MEKSEAVTIDTAESVPLVGRISLRMATAIAFFAALWLILWRQLSGEWSVNDQYSYGWFVPFFSLILFWLRWEDRPEASKKEEGKSRKQRMAISIAVIALLLLLPIRVFEIGNPDWRPLSWLHAFSVVAITFVFLWFIGGRPWIRHFAFPVSFTLIAVPWISPIEAPIVQGLMRGIAAMTSEVVAIFGIPAQVQGTLIRIPNGIVGVNEACSGVRSLQTSLMIGLLFGELKRLSKLNRVLLVAAAAAIALFGNFVRAFFLVWIAATRNIGTERNWHDLAGYGIVVLVFIGSVLLASAFGRREKSKTQKVKIENLTPVRISRFAFRVAAAAVIWIAFVELSAVGWYRAHEQQLTATQHWDVRWPATAASYHEIQIDPDLKSTLRFDRGSEVTWQEHGNSAENSVNYLLFFFRWEPGTSTILRARAHRPDVCLPNAGWKEIANEGITAVQAAPSISLPFRQFTFVRDAVNKQLFAYTFFCIGEDAIRAHDASALELVQPTNWSPPERWRVVRDGIRNPGQQVMELVMVTTEQISALEARDRFARVLPTLIKVEDKATDH